MLKTRYGDIKIRMIFKGGTSNKHSSKSFWWSDILSLENRLSGDFFANNVSFRIGDGFSTSFWHSSWLEEGTLKFLFPSLFAISFLQDIYVACMGAWDGDVWVWNDLGIPLVPEG